jgi:hypothetical protein
MPDFQRGKVYRIVCRKTGQQYVGSTTMKYLSQRLALHAHNHRHSKDNCSSRKVIEGADYFIELLEECPCETKPELLARERHWIENAPCVNKNIAGRSQAERMKQWYIDNREKWNAYQKEYNRKKREALKQEALATK